MAICPLYSPLPPIRPSVSNYIGSVQNVWYSEDLTARHKKTAGKKDKGDGCVENSPEALAAE
jgi:hypothetical protein